MLVMLKDGFGKTQRKRPVDDAAAFGIETCGGNIQRFLAEPFAAAEPGEGNINHNPMQPTAERRAALKLADIVIGIQESVLHTVAGLVLVAQHAPA